MALYHFHRILIAAAILFDVGFTFFSLRRWRRLDTQMDLVMAVLSSVVTLGFIVYLVRFNRKMRRLQSQSAEVATGPSAGGPS